MSPISKFAVFLVLAGVLAALFALVPAIRPQAISSEKNGTHQPANSEIPAPRFRPKVPASEDKAGEAKAGGATAENPFLSKVKVPAIRRGNNYGWVQLPRGTRVDLVRETGDGLLVRWDGTTVKVPPGAAATGAVVVR